MFNILRHVEDRQLIKCFIALAVEEPAKNWYDEQFRWSMAEKDQWFEHWEGSTLSSIL